MTRVYFNGKTYAVEIDGTPSIFFQLFRYSSKGGIRADAICNRRALELAQFRPEMEAERETIRRVLTLFFGADGGINLFKDGVFK